MAFGDRVRDLRIGKGITQDELAKMVGYSSRSTINKIEKNERNVDQSMIVKFAKALDTTPTFLTGWGEDNEIEPNTNILSTEKIVELLAEKNISASKMMKELGFSSGLFSQWKSGKQKPSLEKIYKIANYFGVSTDYLLGNDNEIEPNADILPTEKIRMIPVFESVSAGFGAYACSDVSDYIPLYIQSDYEAEETICIKVKGDSMYPKIEDGDLVVVRKQSSVDSGQIAVVLVDGDNGYVKKNCI